MGKSFYISDIEKVDASTYYQLVDIYGKEEIHQIFSRCIHEFRKQNGDSYEVQLQVWEKFGYYLAMLDRNPFEGVILEQFQNISTGKNYKRKNELFSLEEEVYYGFHLLKRDYIEVFLKDKNFVSLNVGKVFGSIQSMEVLKQVLDKFDYFYRVCDRDSYFDQGLKCYLKECRGRYEEGKLPVVDSSSSFVEKFSSKDFEVLEERMLLDQLDMYIQSSIARVKFVTCNIRFVQSFVNDFYKDSSVVDKAEFEQEGFLGLTRSIDTFDIRIGNKFSTYAYVGIKNSVNRLLCNFSRTIRVPVYCYSLALRIEKERNIFFRKMGREPELCELSGILNIEEKKINSVLQMMHLLNCQSLQSVIFEGEHIDADVLLMDSVPDSKVDVEGQVLSEMTEHSLLEFMNKTLTERERDVLFKRSGYLDGNPMTLEQIGEEFGCTRERIRQIEVEAKKKLTRTKKGRTFDPNY